MATLLGPDWVHSHWVSFAALAIVIACLWRIGTLSVDGDKKTAKASEDIVRKFSDQRAKDMKKWENLAELYFREKRLADATVALNRARTALRGYPGLVDSARNYDSNRNFYQPWSKAGEDIEDDVRIIARSLGVQAPDIMLHRPQPKFDTKGSGIGEVLNEPESAAYFQLHQQNQTVLDRVLNDLDSELRKAQQRFKIWQDEVDRGLQ